MWGISIAVCLTGVLWVLYLSSHKKEAKGKEIEQYSYRQLCGAVQEMLNDYIRETETRHILSADVLQNKEEQRREISDCIRSCNSGNIGAREVVKELIRNYLVAEWQLDKEKILYAVPFHQPEQMSAAHLMECMIYFMEQEKREFGFLRLCEEYSLCGQQGAQGFCFLEEVEERRVREIWKNMQPKLSFQDCLSILAQLLFADTVGLGVIDTLNYQRGIIEEIQLGMNGQTVQKYDYREELCENQEKQSYSKDSIHILIKGNTIKLSYLSFGTEEELQRVLRNLIKDSRAGELTKKQPMAVVDAIDGRRISVSRPPMTDTWAGLIRKFDTIARTTLQELYQQGAQGTLVTEVLCRVIQSGKNIAVTGEMASGKTTLLRACLQELPKEKNLRIIESESFELNVREFLKDRNSLTMRVSEQSSAEDILAFARKTTGQIFVVGEVNTASIAAMVVDLSKIASQILFSAHYTTTRNMITDFVNAKLCVGGYTDEHLAEQEVVAALHYDIHLSGKGGVRRIEYINEIIAEIEEDGNHSYRIEPVLKYVGEGKYYVSKELFATVPELSGAAIFEALPV